MQVIHQWQLGSHVTSDLEFSGDRSYGASAGSENALFSI